MKTPIQLYIASALLLAVQGCATSPEQVEETDLSKLLPPAEAGIPAKPLYFASIKEAEQALSGYNYGLVNLPDGRVQAFVSGLIGSGADNAITPIPASKQSSTGMLAQLTQEEVASPFPQITLDEKKNGQAAIDALGDKLDDVAKSYGMSPERLQEILLTDSTAWVDETGHILYIDTHTEVPLDVDLNQEQATTPTGGNSFSDIANTSDAFALHSKPGSNRVIYLDFNGHVASNTAWYSGDLTAPPYDLDGNPNDFSGSERDNIKEIWQRVAEDYAPFDVDITTEEPTADALQRTSSTDSQYGTRAVITRSTPQLCNQSCGGIAYVNVYSYYSSSNPSRYQPAWVFFDKLGNGYPKYVAEAASHEVGHNLNLNHDGDNSSSYYRGHGDGATGWAPIMGVGYYQPVTQWSKGEYPNANNQQDDIAVIHAAGAMLRADDYANTTSSSSPLGGTASTVAQIGMIERYNDLDIFAFSTGGGDAQFNVSPDPISPNLDVLLKILDAQGNTVAQANPIDSLPASVTTSLAPGQYFLQVEGVGKGDLTTGYSSYGSLGQYQIAGNYPEATRANIAPTASISGSPLLGDAPLTVTLDGSGSSDSDGSIVAYDWNFGDGNMASGNTSTSHAYQSAGTYTATLTVTDNGGLKASASEAIEVTKSPVTFSFNSNNMWVWRKVRGAQTQCVASAFVTYDNAAVPNAVVYGNWSGSVKAGQQSILYTGEVKQRTATTGVANIAGPWVPATAKGTCAFTITNISKPGYIYTGEGDVTASFTW